MAITVLDVLITLFLFSVASVVIVEAVGYFWHRFAEHIGLLGDSVRYRHWQHHQVEYPVESLRPTMEYKDARSWTWYLIGSLTAVVLFFLLPLKYSLPLILGMGFYAQFIVSYFHEVFHLKTHWLHQFGWFKELIRLHDIHHWGPWNYGIVFFWLDSIFGTVRKDFPSAVNENFPDYQHKG